MSWECRFGFRPRDLHHSSTSCGPGSRFQSHQTRSFQPLGSAAFGCLAFRLDLAWLSPVSQRALPRRVQIALKPASKRLGLHGVFIRSKGLKDLIADSAFKRMQVDVQGACRLDADEHHLGLAPRTGWAPNCSEWNDGRQGLRLGHDASLDIGGSTTLSVTGNALGGAVIYPSMRLRGSQTRVEFARARG